jgi:4'-phosphopantetheinyl transferase
MTLFPLILAVPEAGPGLSGEQRVARLSRLSREALRMSAGASGLVLGDPVKDEDDVPIPVNGTWWSVSHKPRCVAAVVSSEPAGIDIEDLEPRSEPPYRLVASEEEWELGGGRSQDLFFRYWTAKEAVLKAAGAGISGLKKCTVVSIPDGTHVLLGYRDRTFRVEQHYCMNHIAAVVQGDNEVEWRVAEYSGCRQSGA